MALGLSGSWAVRASARLLDRSMAYRAYLTSSFLSFAFIPPQGFGRSFLWAAPSAHGECRLARWEGALKSEPRVAKCKVLYLVCRAVRSPATMSLQRRYRRDLSSHRSCFPPLKQALSGHPRLPAGPSGTPVYDL